MTDELEQYWARINSNYIDHAHNAGVDRLVASAVICVNNSVLVVRRSLDDTYPGMWEYPGGGVDSFREETVVDALRREVEEETGIVLPQFPTGEVMIHPTRTAIRVVLRFDLDHKPLVVLSHEHDAYEFINTIDESSKDFIWLYDSMRDENRAILHLIFSSFSSK